VAAGRNSSIILFPEQPPSAQEWTSESTASESGNVQESSSYQHPRQIAIGESGEEIQEQVAVITGGSSCRVNGWICMSALSPSMSREVLLKTATSMSYNTHSLVSFNSPIR
jgi:hypothetical protein